MLERCYQEIPQAAARKSGERLLKVKYYFKNRIPRRFAKAAFEAIEAASRNEPHLLPAHAEEVAESFKAGEAVLALDEAGDAVGYTRLVQLTERKLLREAPWYELGSTWVRSDYRGTPVVQTMYAMLLERHKSRNILATTTNGKALGNGKKFDFALIYRRDLPSHVWRASCVCPASKTGTCNNEVCKQAFGETQMELGPCWFRVTRETAKRNNLPTLTPEQARETVSKLIK